MRVLIAILVVAQPAFAQPMVAPRVGLVARQLLPPRSIGDGRDDRAVVSARIQGGAEALRRAGFEARPLGGDVATLRLDAAELKKLLFLPGLLQIEERRTFYTQLDRATASVGAPAARAESGFDGSGVLVGVVDTGADARHADLRYSDGRTKIEALLDVAVPRDDRHPELAEFGGTVWLRDEIDAALTAEAANMTPAVPFTSVDTNGHGTHVAGIAASTGLATGNDFPTGRYLGVAPGADLIVAKASHGRGQFFEADLLNGCRFAIARAQAAGRPLVLNLSLGGTGGAHDGTTNTEQALAALFPAEAQGRVLVVAAGNEGLTDHHAGGWALDGEVEIPLHVFNADSNGQVAVELWTLGSPAISVVSPSGKLLGPVGSTHVDHSERSEGFVAVDHTTPARSDGRQQSAIVLTGQDGNAVSDGDWRIRLSGRAVRWDLWITEYTGTAHFTDHLDQDNRLGILATTPTAISVGSYVSRNQWITDDGMSIDRPIDVGAASLFSSTGPSSDGRFVPDLSAPGEFIISSLSRDALPDQPTSDFFVSPNMTHYTWADDGVHGLLRGTSQAAPLVAGAVALLFQFDPSLTARQVRELLRSSARDAGAGWSPRLGFGGLDAVAALAATRGRYGTTVDAQRSSVGVSRDQLPPGDQLTTVTVTPRDLHGLPLGPGRNVEITVSAGEPAGPVVDMGLGRYERPIRARAGRGQVGVVNVSVDGVALTTHPNIYFVNGRDEIGRPFQAGGGCSQPGAPSGGGLWLLLLATLVLYRRSNGCSPKPPRL